MARKKYTTLHITGIVDVLKNHASVRAALPDLQKVLPWDVSISGVKEVLNKHGISLQSILNENNNYEMKHTYWTMPKLHDAIQILQKSKTVGEAIQKISKKFDRVVSSSALRNAFRNQSLNMSPSMFLKGNGAKELKEFEKQMKVRSKEAFAVPASTRLKRRKKVAPVVVGSEEPELESIFDKLVDFAKGRGTRKQKQHRGKVGFRDLCDHFDMSPKRMTALIKEGIQRGYRIVLADDYVGVDISLKREKATQVVHNDVHLPGITKGKLRLGVFSDTHFGSKNACKDQCADFMRRAHDDFGVKTFVHSGDILAGNKVYRGQEVELEAWGLEDQCAICAETLPEFKDAHTYYILGNHDVDFIKSAGAHPAATLRDMRKDMTCIGELCETLAVPLSKDRDFIIELAHIKSSAHARSYSLEKHIYRTISKDNSPDVSFSGHRHTNGYFSVQGIDTFLVPCFEAPGYFAKYGDYYPSIGGIVVTFEFDGTGNTSVLDMKWIRYNDRMRSKPTILSQDAVKVA